jgi:hypothetical protein
MLNAQDFQRGYLGNQDYANRTATNMSMFKMGFMLTSVETRQEIPTDDSLHIDIELGQSKPHVVEVTSALPDSEDQPLQPLRHQSNTTWKLQYRDTRFSVNIQC